MSEIIIRTWTDLPRTRIAKSAMPELNVTFPGEPVLHGVIEPAQDNERKFAPSRVSVWGRYPVSPDQLDSLTHVAENPAPFAFTLYSKAVQELVFGTANHQRRMLDRLIELIRWRTGHPSWSSDRTTSGKDSHEEWSIDGSTWHALEVTATLTWDVPEHGPALSQDLQDSLDDLAKGGGVEPLGWEIMHSAMTASERGDSRSVIILAVSAVEIEIKRLIGQLVPDADWLMVNLQAPDVHRMSKSYLPSLPGVPQSGLPPKRLLISLQTAIELRNKLVHVGGRQGMTREEMAAEVANFSSEALATASDLLWLFDYYRGHTWALLHVSPETTSELAKVDTRLRQTDGALNQVDP